MPQGASPQTTKNHEKVTKTTKTTKTTKNHQNLLEIKGHCKGYPQGGNRWGFDGNNRKMVGGAPRKRYQKQPKLRKTIKKYKNHQKLTKHNKTYWKSQEIVRGALGGPWSV
jgi:hypothetical protein